MRRLFSTLAVAALFAIPAQVQAQWTIGPAIAWHDDFDLGVGGFAVTPLPALHENMSIGGDFIYYFPDCGGSDSYDCSFFELNANLYYSFVTSEDAPVTPFVLGGLGIFRYSVDGPSVDTPIGGFDFGGSSTDIGLNIGGGVAFNAGGGGIQPIVGGKLEIKSGTGFVIFGGLGFPVGG